MENNEKSPTSFNKKNSEKNVNLYNKWFIPPNYRFMKLDKKIIIDKKNFVNDFIALNKKTNV